MVSFRGGRVNSQRNVEKAKREMFPRPHNPWITRSPRSAIQLMIQSPMPPRKPAALAFCAGVGISESVAMVGIVSKRFRVPGRYLYVGGRRLVAAGICPGRVWRDAPSCYFDVSIVRLEQSLSVEAFFTNMVSGR